MPESGGNTGADFIALQYRFAAHLRDPDNNPAPPSLDDRRLAIYRDLFFNNIVSLLAGNFPVMRSLHDELAWRSLARDWYRGHPSQTPLFPELGREFVRWLETRSEAGSGDPDWFAELAHYEWMEVVAANDEADIDLIAHDPDGDLLDGQPLVSPLAWPLVYRYAVHQIRPDALPAPQPPATPTCLIIARDRRDRVGFMEANPLTLHLIERIRAAPSSTGRSTLIALAADVGAEPEHMLEAGKGMLRQLHARHILLGTHP